HYDTVRDAGKWDGPLGLITAISCVADLHKRGRRLPFAIEVIGFADEEGGRLVSTPTISVPRRGFAANYWPISSFTSSRDRCLRRKIFPSASCPRLPALLALRRACPPWPV